jgi:hypothetical protein
MVSEIHQASCCVCNGLLSLEVKQPVHESDHSSDMVLKVRVAVAVLILPHMLHVVQMDNFTFVTNTQLSAKFATVFKREDRRLIWQHALTSE